MPALVNPDSFTIQPSAELLSQHPPLKQLSKQLALRYAHNERVTDEMLRAVGEALWQSLALDEAFDTEHTKTGCKILPLVIESDDPAILQLPWETLCHPQQGFMALESGFTLSRRIPATSVDTLDLETGPLRVLLFTAMTEDQQRLNVEDEQAQVQEALMPLIAEGLVILEMPDDGRFQTFQQTLKQYQPHLLFLSGHGKYHDRSLLDQPSYASFLFETEGDDSHAVNGAELAQAFIGTPVQCVVLSACESGQSASDQLNVGLMHPLALQGIPHVIGMRESILDVAGTRFNRSLCDALAQQERIDVALQRARQAITQPLHGETKDSDASGPQALSYGQWCLPILLSQNPARALIDWQFTPQASDCTAARLSDNQSLDGITLPPRFIGRRRELRSLDRALQDHGRNQLLITGPGGQGKTALLGRLAQKLQQKGRTVMAWSAADGGDWSDFQFNLELSLNADNAEKYDRMLPRCKDDARRIKLLLTLVRDQSEQDLVLLFDNLESLQDPQSLQITDALTRSWIAVVTALTGPKLTLLLTSRWLLPDWPPADHWPLEHLSYNDYLQLARQQPLPVGFLHNRERLRQLHTRLHGNARGLEFFAAALQSMDEDEEQRFLDTLAEVSAEVQSDMALASIYSHRSEAEQTLLQRLTAYQTPVAIEGVIKLALDFDDPKSLLAGLLTVSLLEQHYHQTWQCYEYEIPTPVKAWLTMQLMIPPAHHWFLATADYQYYLFRCERQTLSQAMRTHHALRLAKDNTQADHLVLNVIIEPLNRQGLYRTLLNDWLPQVCQSEELSIRGEALDQTGKQYHHLGDFDTALKYLRHSLDIRQVIGDKAGEGATLNNISQIFQARGDFDTALEYLKHSLDILQDIGDKAGEGITLNNISQIYHARGDLDTALEYLKRSLEILQDISDKAGEGTTLNNISQIYSARHDYDTAFEYLKYSLNIQQHIGDKAGEGTTLNNISRIYTSHGDLDTALEYLKRSLDIQQNIGDKVGEGATLNNMAATAHAHNDLDIALEYFNRSLEIKRDIGDKAGLCITLLNMGYIHFQNEQKQEAINAWIKVYLIAKPMQLSQVLETLEELAEPLGFLGGLQAWEALAQKYDSET